MNCRYNIKLAPSILACDFANLQSECDKIKNCAEMLHIDVMDGHFVPNISIGVPVVKALRKKVDMLFDVHLMISNPMDYIKPFADAGADIINFHIESNGSAAEIIEKIKACGKKPAITLKPATPAQAVFDYLKMVDMVLVMTVEPGFGGQSFMSNMLEKISAIRAECERQGAKIDIQADGGIEISTAPPAARAGAKVLVAGSAIFGAANPAQAAENIRQAAANG